MTLPQLFQLAVQHHQAGQLAQAEGLYRQILSVEPNHAPALHMLGTLAYQVGQRAIALELMRRAIEIQPIFPDAYADLGHVLLENGEVDASITACEQALSQRPAFARAMNNLGNALVQRGSIQEAINVLRRALALHPNYAKAHANLGLALLNDGRLDDAIASYHTAIAIWPDYAQAHWNLALALLRKGDFAGGWSEFEWRWKWEQFPSPRRDFSCPMWAGESIEGRTLLLHTEQGLGDAMQMVRYVPHVLSRGAKLIVECQPELVRLFRQSAGGCEIIERGQSLPAVDLHCPMMSLPLIFGTMVETIPQETPYLRADRAAASKWGERLANLPAGRTIGLCWAGSRGHIHDAHRSMSLSALSPLLETPGALFVSLQKGDAVENIAKTLENRMIDWTDEIADFADTAALVQHLDLVITVDTAVAHLAGAMGKPVWVMLPFVADWRWMLDRSDSPWYPSMRLFRQPTRGDWVSVVRTVAAALRGG